MLTYYPDAVDFEHLQSVTNDDSWAPDNMRKYFERLERVTYLPNYIVGHGFNGWLTTSVTDLTLVLQDLQVLSMVVAAATAMGNGLAALVTTVTGVAEILLNDYNTASPGRDVAEGLYQVPMSIKSGARNGPREFILEVANAVNDDGSKKYKLDVRMQCLVSKIRFSTNGTTPKAIGVDFLDGESLYRADPRATNTEGGIPGSVDANKEIIISAGVFNTPQILKLSGVGPKEELEKWDIPVVVDLPGVGTNMQDRYEIGATNKFPRNFTLTEDCTFKLTPEEDPCLKQYQTNPIQRGVYTTSGLAMSAIKQSTAAAKDQQSITDLFMFGVPAYFKGYFPAYSTFGVADSKHFSWLTLKSHSRNNAGTVTLKSTDPRDTPEIVFNYFDTGVTANGEDELDLQAIYEGFQTNRKTFASALPLIGDSEEVWPGKSVKTEQQIKDYIKREAWGHHASCSCPIGADDDPLAVLDTRFRVRGVEGLRVVDASVFPKIPGKFIAAPIYMISEKAADIIIEDHANDVVNSTLPASKAKSYAIRR
ncbi:Oxygen-dependent choline dehydrogenase 1 [Phlyctema vagabunda]|uniref:Oxygen-dependent choline dehydrogenase 1 n=1 Tax=Phlyctema vagabunda TaxID=108571 RepID=A0ABR4PAU6_9HELO